MVTVWRISKSGSRSVLPPGAEGIFEGVDPAHPRLGHALLDDIGHPGDDDRDAGTVLLQFLEEGNDLLPVVEGALDDRPVRHAAQDIVHRRVVDVARFHIAQVDRAVLVADAQKLSGLGRRSLLVDAGRRTAQDDEIVRSGSPGYPCGANCVS